MIPSSIARPVSIEHDGRKLSFDLRGATGGRDVAGAKAVFDDALSGVDIAYKARGNGLKENIVLASPQSQRSFVYDVVGDADLAAAVGPDGQLVFKDSDGVERFRVSAPLAWDSAEPKAYANALTLAVDKVQDGKWTVTLRADDAWLDDPARVYPVTLDPDYYWVDAALRFHGANQDCYLAGGIHAGISFCAANVIQVGYTGNKPYRGIFRFDVASAIPAYATATRAQFLLWQPQSTTESPADMRLRTITKDWNNTATWDVAKTGAPWTSGGADVSTDPNLIGPPTTVGAQNYWSYWEAPLAAVNGWIKGTLPNYGLQLTTDPGAPPTTAYVFTSTDGDQALWPALDVTWVPDTTAPGQPTGLRLGGVDPDDQAAYVLFTRGTDPTNGAQSVSGVDRTEVRVQRGSAPFGAWSPTSLSAAHKIAPIAPGDQLTVQVRTVDRAGNLSPVTSGTFTAVLSDEQALEQAAAVAYTSTEFGLTTPQAEAWLDVQNRSAQLELAIAASAAAPNFAGMWFDNAQRKARVLVSSTATNSTINSLVSSRNLTADVTIQQVANSEGALGAGATQSQTALAADVAAGKVQISADLPSGTVLFEVPATVDPAVDARVQQQRQSLQVPTSLRRDPVRPTFAGELIGCTHKGIRDGGVPNQGIQYTSCTGALRGGTVIYTNENLACTLGFLGRARSNDEKIGVTAGHCLRGSGEEGTWTENGQNGSLTRATALASPRIDGNADGLLYKYPLGTPRKWVYSKTGIDAASFTLGSNFDTPFNNHVLILKDRSELPNGDEVDTERNPRYPITGSATPRQGAVICRTGARSGNTKCGRVSKRTLRGFTSARVDGICSLQGDSGGPVVRKNLAYGISIYGFNPGYDRRDECWTEITGARSLEEELKVDILSTSS